MNLCISKFLLGTDYHLAHDNKSNTYSWTSHVPEKTWFYGNAPNCKMSLNDLCLLFYIDPKDKPAEKYVSAYTVVGLPAGLSVPWHLALPRKVFQKFISDLVEDLWRAIKQLDDTTYRKRFLINREALTRLSPSCIDIQKLKHLLAKEKNPTLLSTLKSFQPLSNEFIEPPVYQQGSTGRTIVKRGPKILTLKKDFRTIFKSRYTGGKIVQLDYTSLEPRIMMALSGKDPSRDIYKDVAKDLSLDLDRTKLKIAVMGALYGISAVRLQSMVSRTVDASIVLDKIKKIFKINELGNRLAREYRTDSKICNFYGRPLTFTKPDKHLFVSHYVQSTGVDVCLGGFNKIIDTIKSKDLKISPIYIIHDALILDVAPEEFNSLKKLAASGAKIDGFNIDFPISISDVSESDNSVAGR
ncbi:DNA polymerase [bacterium]|nr:DNA polymerase [bacterium]